MQEQEQAEEEGDLEEEEGEGHERGMGKPTEGRDMEWAWEMDSEGKDAVGSDGEGTLSTPKVLLEETSAEGCEDIAPVSAEPALMAKIDLRSAAEPDSGGPPLHTEAADLAAIEGSVSPYLPPCPQPRWRGVPRNSSHYFDGLSPASSLQDISCEMRQSSSPVPPCSLAAPPSLSPTASPSLRPADPSYLSPTAPPCLRPADPTYLNPTAPRHLSPADPSYLSPTATRHLSPADPSYLSPTGPSRLSPESRLSPMAFDPLGLGPAASEEAGAEATEDLLRFIAGAVDPRRGQGASKEHKVMGVHTSGSAAVSDETAAAVIGMEAIIAIARSRRRVKERGFDFAPGAATGPSFPQAAQFKTALPPKGGAAWMMPERMLGPLAPRAGWDGGSSPPALVDVMEASSETLDEMLRCALLVRVNAYE